MQTPSVQIDTIWCDSYHCVFILIYFLVALSGAVLFEKIDKVIAILSVVVLSIIIYIIGFSMVYAVGTFAVLSAVGSMQQR